jgi:translation initiation factor 2 subunit 2
MSYEELLERAYEKLPKVKEQKERFEVPQVDSDIQGNVTIFKNFVPVAQAVRREPKHLLKYLTKQMATPGNIEGPRAIFQSKLAKRVIQGKLENYVKDFVMCKECKRPDTKLVKEGRIIILKCEACGAKAGVRSI